MIQSMAQAGVILNEPRYLNAAVQASEFILQHMTNSTAGESLRLLHSWRHGKAKLNAYLDDYSYLANAYTTLYECTADSQWLDQAVALTETALKHFLDQQDGGFFFTSDDHEQLITRNKDSFDSSVPSGNSMMAYVLVRLGKLCNNIRWLEIAEQTIQNSALVLQRAPGGCGQMLLALDLLLNDTQELVIATDQQSERDEIKQQLYSGFIPRRTIAYINHADTTSTANVLSGLGKSRTLIDNQTTVYICRNFSCQKPLSNRGEIKSAFDTMKAVFS